MCNSLNAERASGLGKTARTVCYYGCAAAVSSTAEGDEVARGKPGPEGPCPCC